MESVIIVNIGRRKQGKTLLAKKLLKNSPRRRKIIYETVSEKYPYQGLLVTKGKDLVKAIKQETEYIRIRNSDKKFFSNVCNYIKHIPDTLFVVEEINFFATAQNSPQAFEDLLRYGRHYDLDLVITTQRPHRIPINIVGLATTINFFRITHPIDLDFMRRFINLSITAQVKDLRERQYFAYNVDKDTWKKKSIPKSNFT